MQSSGETLVAVQAKFSSASRSRNGASRQIAQTHRALVTPILKGIQGRRTGVVVDKRFSKDSNGYEDMDAFWDTISTHSNQTADSLSSASEADLSTRDIIAPALRSEKAQDESPGAPGRPSAAPSTTYLSTPSASIALRPSHLTNGFSSPLDGLSPSPSRPFSPPASDWPQDSPSPNPATEPPPLPQEDQILNGGQGEPSEESEDGVGENEEEEPQQENVRQPPSQVHREEPEKVGQTADKPQQPARRQQQQIRKSKEKVSRTRGKRASATPPERDGVANPTSAGQDAVRTPGPPVSTSSGGEGQRRLDFLGNRREPRRTRGKRVEESEESTPTAQAPGSPAPLAIEEKEPESVRDAAESGKDATPPTHASPRRSSRLAPPLPQESPEKPTRQSPPASSSPDIDVGDWGISDEGGFIGEEQEAETEGKETGAPELASQNPETPGSVQPRSLLPFSVEASKREARHLSPVDESPPAISPETESPLTDKPKPEPKPKSKPKSKLNSKSNSRQRKRKSPSRDTRSHDIERGQRRIPEASETEGTPLEAVETKDAHDDETTRQPIQRRKKLRLSEHNRKLPRAERVLKSQEEPGARRTGRARVRPTEYWRNERPVYQCDRIEDLGLGRNKRKKAASDLDIGVYKLISVIEGQPEESQRRPRPSKKRRAALAFNEEKSRIDPEQIYAENPHFRYKTDGTGNAKLWDEVDARTSKCQVVVYRDQLNMNPIPQQPNVRAAQIVRYKQFQIPEEDRQTRHPDSAIVGYPGWVAGRMSLGPGQWKKEESVSGCSQFFHVLEGEGMSLELAVDEEPFKSDKASRFLLSKGDSFFVPPLNVYRLENRSTSVEAELLWNVIGYWRDQNPSSSAPSEVEHKEEDDSESES